MKEEVLLLGPHKSLVGIYTPAASSDLSQNANFAAILLNAGLVHHVGPHRLHVKLARALALKGISSLRLDLSGIGDSPVRLDNLPVQEAVFQEPREVMDDLVKRGYDNFVLFGICSGAKYALQAASGDPRVRGLVLVNPAPARGNREQILQASTQFYLGRSLWNPRAWCNFFTGRVKYKALFKTLVGAVWRKLIGGNGKKERMSDIIRQELEPVLNQGVRLLGFLSDRHAQYYELLDDGLQDLLESGQLQIEVHPKADHVFTPLDEQERLVAQTCCWAENLQRTTL